MEIIITKDRQSRAAATLEIVIKQIKEKPNSVFIFPADTTHTELYDELTRLCQGGEISFTEAIAFQLDEYSGIDETDQKSLVKLIKEKLFDKTDFKKENIYLLSGYDDAAEKCRKYEEKLAEYGQADLCILGIGRNGHVAFDEPGVDPSLGVHLQKLSQETVTLNKGPVEAVTLGIRNIMSAKKLILSADGEAKAVAIKSALEGPISTECPASLLREHSDITFIIDEAAAILLDKKTILA